MALEREGIERDTAEAVDSFLARAWSAQTRREWLLDRGFPNPLWDEISASGWFDLLVPEAESGLGLTVIEACAVAESAGRHLVPGPVVDNVVLSPYVRTLRTGHAATMMCLLLANDGARSAGQRAAAVRGEAAFAQGLEGDWAAAADGLVIDAGDRVVIVERSDRRVRVTRLDGRDAFRQACRVDIDGAPVAGVIAEGREVERLRATVRNRTLIMVAATLLGVAERMLEMSLQYAVNRRQFGRPIGAFQAVQHRLADMAVAVASMRSMCYRAQVAERDGDGDAEMLTMVAKAHASACAREVAEAALQVHGGVGFTAQCDLSLYLLRTLTLQSTWGDDYAWSRALGMRTLADAASASERDEGLHALDVDGGTARGAAELTQTIRSINGLGGERL